MFKIFKRKKVEPIRKVIYADENYEYKISGYKLMFRWSPESWEKREDLPDFTDWEIYWTNKIYRNEKIANEALESVKKVWALRKMELKIVPLFEQIYTK